MSAISQKSISGITSITSPAGTDDQISLHTSNTNEALKIDGAGNLHLNNHVNTTGVSTASNFKTGSSNLHNVGIEIAGVNVLGADTPIGAGATIFNSGDIVAKAGAEFQGIVTATSMDVDDFLDVGSNIKLGNAGVITATSFVGDGSDLTNLPAGLGTALSATASSPLNKMYYTNQVLGVPSSVTVDVPASASKAYTQYADIKVDGSADLIVAEGDDLIPDILGLADFGTFGGGASAGRIRVNSISNAANDGSPTVQKGLVVTGVTTSTTFSGSGASLTNLPAANLTGTLPAISGANLTNLDASDLASGTVPTARLGSGTANSSTFLAGDSTYKTVNTDLVNDTSPQLGGNLDTNSHEISLDTSHAINFGDGTEMNMKYHGGHGQIIYTGNNSLQLKVKANSYFQVVNNDTGDNIIQAQAGGKLLICHAGTQVVETSTNGLAFPSGKGIDFSAHADNATGNLSETLYDYESGSWQPTWSPASGSIGHQSRHGDYVKIGKVVHCMFAISANGSTNPSGELKVSGLPFTADIPNAQGLRGGGGVAFAGYHMNTSVTKCMAQGSNVHIILSDNSRLQSNSSGIGYGYNAAQLSGMFSYITSS